MKVVALKCRFLTSFTSVAVPVLRLSTKLRTDAVPDQRESRD